MTLDPITLSVIQAGLQQVCDEMDLAFSRAAFSPVIAEANDRSDGIYDATDGALIAQGVGGLPVFVGTMQYSTRTLISMIGEGRVGAPEPGDIYIVNDPYLGGTHLMDVRFARPYYRDGALFCWLSNTGHWPDTGGAVPGGFSASATSVEQEGLRLPPVKLFKRGVMDAEIYAIICSNIRVADQRIGEVMEQAFPVLYHRYALRDGSGGAGKHRGGFGLEYEVELRRGTAQASFVMDHGRFGPQGALGGADGAVNEVTVWQAGVPHVPVHLSKEQDIPLAPGDRVCVRTPGGGGYGNPFDRDPSAVAEDVRLGRYTRAEGEALFGVALQDGPACAVDVEATRVLRSGRSG